MCGDVIMDIIQTSNRYYNYMKPLVGGASAIAIGAAIGTGVISDKGVDLNKVPKVDPGDVVKSVKSLELPGQPLE